MFKKPTPTQQTKKNSLYFGPNPQTANECSPHASNRSRHSGHTFRVGYDIHGAMRRQGDCGTSPLHPHMLSVSVVQFTDGGALNALHTPYSVLVYVKYIHMTERADQLRHDNASTHYTAFVQDFFFGKVSHHQGLSAPSPPTAQIWLLAISGFSQSQNRR